MKVKDCWALKCPYLQRKVWSDYYQPANYHAIGMSHAYAYCDKFGCPCRKVKNCKSCPIPKERKNV